MISLGVSEVVSLGDSVSVPSPSTCRPIVTRVNCSKVVLPYPDPPHALFAQRGCTTTLSYGAFSPARGSRRSYESRRWSASTGV